MGMAVYSPRQREIMQNVTWVKIATSNGRCDSAFKITPGAIRKAVNDYGLDSGGFDPEGETISILRAAYIAYYDIPKNQETFCKYTLEHFGPTSEYEHMIDLK